MPLPSSWCRFFPSAALPGADLAGSTPRRSSDSQWDHTVLLHGSGHTAQRSTPAGAFNCLIRLAEVPRPDVMAGPTSGASALRALWAAFPPRSDARIFKLSRVYIHQVPTRGQSTLCLAGASVVPTTTGIHAGLERIYRFKSMKSPLLRPLTVRFYQFPIRPCSVRLLYRPLDQRPLLKPGHRLL